MPEVKNIKTVETWDDIYKNIKTLESYRDSKNEDENKYYSNLIKKGNCFVVCLINGNKFFAPSRFIGYINNSKIIHEGNTERDGRITTPIIEKILGEKFLMNSELENNYWKFCSLIGITPNERATFGKSRKYIWYTNTDTPNSLIDDLTEIQNNKTIANTVRVNLVSARIGQGYFRDLLIKLWKCCCVTGCKEITILRASHIKPWKNSNNEERLDKYNGLLLVPNLDALFDKGLISFKDAGQIIISTRIKKPSLEVLGVREDYKIKVYPQMKKYLQYHRENVFV